MLAEDFLKTSWPCVKAIVEKLASFKKEKNGNSVSLFRFRNGERINSTFERNRFFLRGSVEYSNPQLTVEEVQGIIGTRMLETCGNYFNNYGLHEPDANGVDALSGEPAGDLGVANQCGARTPGDLEPDRYSM